jgi:hypothetical protein
MKSIPRAALPVVVLAAASLVQAPRVAHADPNNPTDNDKAAARPFAIEGLRLAQAGDCKGAVDKLERGEALVHAPTTAVPLAQCDIQLGRIVAGTEILNRVINETLPPNAPASWAESKQQAKAILDAATPRIAKLRIHVDLPPGVTPNPEVMVDGQLVPNVLLDNDRPTDPGTHHVTARQQGFGGAEADVTLLDGQSKPVSLQLTGNGAAAGVGAAPGATQPAAMTDPYGAQAGATAGTPAAASSAASTSGGALAFSSASGFPVALEFGARLAFGFPFGGTDGGNGDDLDHTVSNIILPLWLNFGVRLGGNWYVGSYVSYGVVSTADQFNSTFGCGQTGFSCSGNQIRFGVEGQYHFIPENRFDPWVGLGFGYEWLNFSDSLSAAATAANFGVSKAVNLNFGPNGWEFLNIQAGIDFRFVRDMVGVGPFVSFSPISEFVSKNVADSSLDGGSQSQSITNQSFHQWLIFGVRGDFDLNLNP